MNEEISTLRMHLEDEVVQAMAAGHAFTLLYLPAGHKTISAWVGGKPKTLVSVVQAGDEQILQRDLERMQASGPEPYGDLGHDDKVRSYVPRRFFWQEGRGIMLEAVATGAGAEAISGGNQPYHSPVWLRNRATGRPMGLAGRNVGGLVPNPAFQDLEKIAARHAAGAETNNGDEPNQPTNQPHMKTELIMAALAAAGILSPSEASADNAPALLTERLGKLVPKTELEAAQAKLAEIEVKAADARSKRAKDLVAEAVKAGRIAPKDEKAQAFWEKALNVEDDSDAVAAMNALPAKGVPGKVIEFRAEDRETVAAGAASRERQQKAEIEAVYASNPGLRTQRDGYESAFAIARGKNPGLFTD